MYVRGNLGEEGVSWEDPSVIARAILTGQPLTETQLSLWESLSESDQTTYLNRATAALTAAVEKAVTMTPTTEAPSTAPPPTEPFLERELVAGTGIKGKHAVLGAGALFLVATLGRKRR